MKREGNKPPEIVSLRELQNSWSKLVVARQHGRLPRTLVDLEEAVNVTVFSLGMRTESLVALALEHQATPFKRQQALKHRREIQRELAFCHRAALYLADCCRRKDHT